MRVTIIPIDGAVYVNDLCRQPLTWAGTPVTVHALQWYEVSGWIEHNDGSLNEAIEALPQWAENAIAAWEQAGIPVPPEPPSAADNKQQAMGLLSATDWTALPDVSDPLKSNPYLANANEFNNYRNAVRQYAINPVAGEIVWPTMPTEDWQLA
jgi:hypothetical protein